MSPVDPILPGAVPRPAETRPPGRIVPAHARPPLPEPAAAAKAVESDAGSERSVGESGDLTAALLSFVEPPTWKGVIDGSMLDRLARVGDRLAAESDSGDELAGWGALIVRHELNKHELLRDYLDTAGWR